MELSVWLNVKHTQVSRCSQLTKISKRKETNEKYEERKKEERETDKGTNITSTSKKFQNASHFSNVR